MNLVKTVSSRLFIREEHSIGIPRDHSEIAKFDSPSDQHYEVLVGYMRKAIDDVIEQKGRMHAASFHTGQLC